MASRGVPNQHSMSISSGIDPSAAVTLAFPRDVNELVQKIGSQLHSIF